MANEFDLRWYTDRGKELGSQGRCRFANVHLCPRYFQSVALLSEEKITDRLPAEVDAELTKKWSKSMYWPATGEDASAVVNRSMFRNFCPEVSFETFRHFGTNLTRYSDSIDREHAYRKLEAEKAGPGDARWDWEWIKPMHFVECPLYSQLSHARQPEAVGSEEILTMKPGAFGFSVDLRRALNKLARWWLTKG